MLIEVKGIYIETEGVIGIRDYGDYTYDEYYMQSVVMYKDGGEVIVEDVSTKELANMINEANAKSLTDLLFGGKG